MGDAREQANPAHLLDHGKGVPMNIEAAKRLYRQAEGGGGDDAAAAADFRRLDGQ